MSRIRSQHIVLILLLLFRISLSFDPNNVLSVFENILSKKSDSLYARLVNSQLDDHGNLWLSWEEWDKKPTSAKEWDMLPPGKKFYMYWYVQKFNPLGKPAFDAVQVAKREGPSSYVAGIFLGQHNDVYAFPGACYLERIDEFGNHFTSRDNYGLDVKNMFIDPNEIMYVFGHEYEGGSGSGSRRAGHRAYAKFKVDEPLPTFIEKNRLPQWPEKGYGKYDWHYSDLIHCDSAGHYALFVRPPRLWRLPYTDTTKINIYEVKLPDLVTIETSSFRVNEAVHKKIRGCKLRTEKLTSRGTEPRAIPVRALVESNDDTLVLYLPCRNADEDLIYVCRLTTDGQPIQAEDIVEEEVKNFEEAPAQIHRRIILRGGVTGILGEPTGIMIYGFDNDGNVYYHVWDQSDDFYK